MMLIVNAGSGNLVSDNTVVLVCRFIGSDRLGSGVNEGVRAGSFEYRFPAC